MLNTKEDFRKCLENILNPLKPYYTEGNAGVKCGTWGVHYGEASALMEGFARPLWGLAPLWAGGGDIADFSEICLDGIRNGTNPEHPEYWGHMFDYDQKIVETAALGLALIIAPDKIWEPLSDKEKDNFYNWLSEVNTVNPVDNNWNFFSVLVNLGFKNIGRPADDNVINHAISRFDTFYKGNGWYSDGVTDQFDYYISFAIHFYSLIYAKVTEKTDPENSEKFKKRAELFARDFIYWFDDEGRALAFGRSLTYRFAQVSFWSACLFAGVKPFSVGVMKGIIARNLEHWLALPIFDNSHVLTVGYAYPNLTMSEDYNAFGSPYWALKTFLILALPDDSEFYNTPAEPLPELSKLHVIPEARMTVQRINGYVTALTSGQWAGFSPAHTPEKYSKFAYSSKYAFSVPRTYWLLRNAGTDNMLAFLREDTLFVRRKCSSYDIAPDGTITSEWSPFEGVDVKTVLIPTDDGHIRRHTVVCDKPYIAYDCGMATPDDLGEVTGNGETEVLVCTPNTNLMHHNTKMKMVKYELVCGTNEIETRVVYPK